MKLAVDIGSMGYSAPELQCLAEGHQEQWQVFASSLRRRELPICRPFDGGPELPGIKSLAGYLNEKYRNVLLLGIGGSALGARTLLQFCRGPHYNLRSGGRARLFILDNIDSGLFRDLQNILDFRETALVYVSKSGSTPETAAAFQYFFRLYSQAGGKNTDVVMICDPGDNGANRVAARLGCRFVPLWPELPGRYSVLSPAGLLPAEIIGVDSLEMLAGARRVHESLADREMTANPLALLGLALYASARNRRQTIHVLFNYGSRLSEFGLWFSQLWGESLGKADDLDGVRVNAGTTPLPCVGATDQHSLLQLFREGPADKVFGFVRVLPGPERLEIPCCFEEEVEYAYFAGKDLDQQMGVERMSTELSLFKGGAPCYGVELADGSPSSLGALLYFYQALTVWSARLWNLDPFNQPGVEEGKRMTYALMGRTDYQPDLPQVQADMDDYRDRRMIFGL